MALRRLALVILALLAAAGCATIRRERTLHREQLLEQAGFERKVAESPQQQTGLRRLPPRMLARVPRGDEVAYVYADADYCECLYVGSEPACETFLRLLTRELIDNDYRDTANPDPVVSAEEMARYERLAREAVVDPTADASVDWSVWP
jgi:hypothetical protein